MKEQTQKEKMDELIAVKREQGTINLRLKVSKIHEPGEKALFKKKQIKRYNDLLHSLHIQIRRKGENGTVAEQLYLKNKHREELKLYRLQQSILTIEGYIKIMQEKPKKGKKKVPLKELVKVIEETAKVGGFDPMKYDPPVLTVEDFVPPDPIEKIIELTPEEKKAIRRQQLEAQIAEAEAELEFICPHCDRIYATESSRKRHITMRHKEI